MRQIDLQKILLVVNSSVAQSGLDAADYISRRGLNPAHVLSFNMGTTNRDIFWKEVLPITYSSHILCTTAPYTGQIFCEAIRNYVEANQIEAVIVSNDSI